MCFKCFEFFEELTNCESKIVKLKYDLWTVYKETCEKHGERAETHIQGVSTQTDIYKCQCKANENENNTHSKNFVTVKETNGCYEKKGNYQFCVVLHLNRIYQFYLIM